MLICDGQNAFKTKYGLFGIVQAYNICSNIMLLPFKTSRYIKNSSNLLWTIAGSLLNRVYTMVLNDFTYRGATFRRGEILLRTQLSLLPLKVANSFLEFLENHVQQLEMKILTTRNGLLFRYPESSQYITETVTNGVRIKGSALYVPEDSRPNHYMFFYRVTISMDKDEDPAKSCQLIRRHWDISTTKGTIFVDGEGVIGLFPTITPGVKFEYCSKSELEVEYGSMSGYFTMVSLSNPLELVQCIIPKFYLTVNQH
eukprot:gene5799-7212_t